MKIKQEEKISIITAGILTVLFGFTVSHVDCNTITTWGYDLLDAISKGRFMEFPVFTYQQHGMPTNYSLFVNAIVAIWLLPLYIIQKLIGATWSILVYDTWFKCFHLVIHTCNLLLLNRIIEKKFDEQKLRRIFLFCYMTSAVVLVTVLGKGQVDNFVVFFSLLGILLLSKKRTAWAMILWGCAFCIKPFVILLMVPFLLLYMGRVGRKSIGYIMLCLIPYICDQVLTHCVMKDYAAMKALTSQMFKDTFGSSRVEEIFSVQINNILVFFGIALVICFICLKIGMEKKDEWWHYLTLPTLLFMGYGIFVSDTCYWFIVIMPAVCILGMSLQYRRDFYLLLLGSNLGVVIYTYVLEQNYRVGINYSFLALLGLKDGAITGELAQLTDIQMTVCKIGATLFLLCMVMIVLLFMYEQKKPVHDKNEPDMSVGILDEYGYWLQVIPVVLYLFAIYVNIG